ncbi:MAG: helix-turn-helix domain-containing protein [Dysgonomonas sp.]|nr:helix-turn-helix domain-containing protein [Dysgonomonas sp.]
MEKLNFGKKLIEIRKAKGLTQEEVAEKCKIAIRTIQRIESGSVEPRAFTIKLISETLGFDFFEASNTGHVASEKEKDSNAEKHTILWYIKDLFNLKTNTMKKVSILSLSTLIIGFTVLFSVSEINAEPSAKKEQITDIGQDSRTNYVKTKDKIEVAFTNQLTFDSLVYIKNDLKSVGITIEYKSIEFDSKNQLISIKCDVDCNDGFKGGFSIGSLDSINKNKRIGFYRDYSPKAKSAFGTGSLEK